MKLKEENTNLLEIPDHQAVKEVVDESNQHAAPGSDGIPSLLYSKCWHIIGSALTEVVQEIWKGGKPTESMRTSLMVFGSKPKKMHSLKPGDKRRISLLNSDFKVVTGLEAKVFGKTATRTLSPLQLVAGSNRPIHHGINLARDAIYLNRNSKQTCGILDLDFLAGFDWLKMAWVYSVLEKKGVSKEVIKRMKKHYQNNFTKVVTNNTVGKTY